MKRESFPIKTMVQRYGNWLATASFVFLLSVVGYFFWQKENNLDKQQFFGGYLEESQMFLVEKEADDPVPALEERITFPIALNSATLEELMALPNIGEQRATDILTYRETQGRFSSLEEIMEISGIGESTFQSLVDLIVLE